MVTRLSSLVAFFTLTLTSTLVLAADGEAGGEYGLMALAVAVGIGLAAAGGAYGQSRAASAALEGIARNPNASDKVFVPMIISLVFIESLVLFTWLLMLFINQKIIVG